MAVQAGVDGCRGGWIAAVAEIDAQPEIRVFGRFAALVDALPEDALIAVDMPIGLPECSGPGGRGPEKLVRPLLGMRQSSVFSIPSRAAVYSSMAPASSGDDGWLAAHRRASAAARETSDPPRGVSIQAFGLFAKIRELDTLLRENPPLRDRVFETHPELCFWRLNGRRPLCEPKKVKGAVYAPGLAERRRLLATAGFDADRVAALPPAGAAEDDLLDALAVLGAARNRAAGRQITFPDPPARDAHGLPIAISC
ncbi:MAG: DUF429 domain-containing protein [Rhizobiaceae bacterium]|nr:DUF429 domain-containing protein [Rhizobiaceae bacterium]